MNSPSDPSPTNPAAEQTDAQREDAYQAVYESDDFKELRWRFRRFVFPVTAAALAFYFLYVLLAAYAPGFMSEKVVGNFNVGLIFGLLQFVMVFAVTSLYVSYARRVLDPVSEKIRGEMEAGGLK